MGGECLLFLFLRWPSQEFHPREWDAGLGYYSMDGLRPVLITTEEMPNEEQNNDAVF